MRAPYSRVMALASLALVLTLLSACAVYDTAADLVGLPESRKPMSMSMQAAPPLSNIYDVEVNDSTLDYLKHRRAVR